MGVYFQSLCEPAEEDLGQAPAQVGLLEASEPVKTCGQAKDGSASPESDDSVKDPDYVFNRKEVKEVIDASDNSGEMGDFSHLLLGDHGADSSDSWMSDVIPCTQPMLMAPNCGLVGLLLLLLRVMYIPKG